MKDTTQNYLIGSYQFDPRMHLLLGPKGQYYLAPDLEGVIAVLVEHAGEPVRRDEIIDAVWEGDENANRLLTLNVRSLRRYLGDSCRNPRFIETIPGYGYRLVAPVRPLLAFPNRDDSPEPAARRPQEKSGLWEFFIELRNRKVCRAALMYALAIWLVCQIAEVVFGALNFPDWALPLIVIAGILGFPIALILAWTFEITPSGLALDIPVASNESGKHVTRNNRWNFALLAASVLISIQMLLYGFDFIDRADDNLERLKSAESIIVTPFQAASVSLETKAYAFALSEQIRHLLRAEYRLEVISANALTNLSGEQKNADLLLQGSVTMAHGEIQVMMHLVDPEDGYDLWSDMLHIPDSGTTESRHQAARRMLRALPIGSAETGEKTEVLIAKAN